MNEPLKSKPPTKNELFYIKWGEESIKKNIENAHSTLTQFLTLNTALMGGSILFMKPENINKEWLSLSLILFFIGLFTSFLGILPHETKVNPISPSQIKEHKNNALVKQCFS